MDYNRLANSLRVIGAGILLTGVYYKRSSLWIPGVIIMIVGSILRIVLKYQKRNDN